MKSYRYFIVMVAALALVAGCDRDPSPSSPAPTDAPGTLEELGHGGMPFSDVQIFFEFNSTANDAGIQVFLDGDPWKEVEITDSRGRELLEIEADGGGFRKLGLTELRFEGAEPDPDETFDAFRPGEYRFRGRAIEGFRLTGSATLSHDFPAAPVFSPSQGETVDPDDVVIEWEEIGGVELYEVIVESDENDFVFDVIVGSETTSMQVPSAFLQPNTLYKAEILAIGSSGNRTITEGTFVTGP